MPHGMYSKYDPWFQYTGTMIDHGNVYINQGKYYESILSFNKVLQDDPTNIMALKGKGYALGKLQKYDDVISSLDMALKL